MDALRRKSVALALFTATLVVMALVGLGWALFHLSEPAQHQVIYVLTGASLIAVGAIFSAPLPARIPMRITLTPTACLVCASALPAPWVIVCVAVGASAAKVLTRYPRSASVHKAVHNISKDIVAAMLAAAVMSLYDVRPTFDRAVGVDLPIQRCLFAIASAALVIWLLDELATTTAVCLSTGRKFKAMLRYMWQMRLIVGVTEAVISGVAATLISLDKRAFIILPVAMLVLHGVLSLRLKLREERRVWEKLAALIDALTTREFDEVLRTAARGAVDLFGARAAEVEVGASRRLVRADGDALVVYDGAASGAPRLEGVGPPSIVQEVGAEVAGVHGVLRIYLQGPRDVLTPRERSTMRALASAISTSVDIAFAYQRLSEESAGHALAATQDAVTGLSNRMAFTRRVVEAEGTDSCHLIAIGLENFKFISEAIGRDRADSVLAKLAQRLERSFREHQAAVGRIGDHEFGVAVWASSEAKAYQRACWAVSNLRREVQDGGQSVAVRASAGMVSGPRADAEELLKLAERRMRRSVQQGRDLLVATTEQPGPLTLGAELRNSRMSISFRPIVDLASGATVLAQALPRWLYSPYEVLSADEYVYQLIDDQEVLDALTETTLTRSLAAAQTWRAKLSHAGLVIPVPGRSVNAKLVQAVGNLLGKFDAPPATLVLAIAPSEGIQDLDAYRGLRRSGVRFMLQEFGSGDRSLELLSAAEFDFVSVHAAYALDGGWSTARSTIRAAVDLGRDLDMSVVVPGVVDEQHRRELLQLGCSLGAGPLFGDETFPSEFRDNISRQRRFEPVAVDVHAVRLRRHRAGGITQTGGARRAGRAGAG
ncbi:EAL domain-containing protein [Micromonospora taraxaci]|uniref:EAL domain-containing protein n=1 Tax=Micromonospora taraxaci TaxID=1316803 RepID=UPI0033CB8766